MAVAAAPANPFIFSVLCGIFKLYVRTIDRIYPINSSPITSVRSFYSLLDGEGAAQPAVIAPARVGVHEPRREDVDLDRLQA